MIPYKNLTEGVYYEYVIKRKKEDFMAKGIERKKETKKKPAATLKEKRAAKKEKKTK